jgi:lysophospholipase L1-like esterase
VTTATRCILVAALVALSACGGDNEQTPAEPNVPIVATLGDSITAGAPHWSPNPGLRTLIATRGRVKRSSQWQYWAGAATDGALRFRNCGVEGDRTDEIEPRLAGCTAGADVVVIQGGTNDVTQGRTPAAAAVNIRDMVRRAQAAGLRALVTTVPPINRRYPEWARGVRRLNVLIAAVARKTGVSVIDFFGQLEDPRNPNRMPAGWTADGIHPNVEGYARLGRAAARQLQ